MHIAPLSTAHTRALFDAIVESSGELVPWLGPRYAMSQAQDVEAFVAEWTAAAANGSYYGFVAMDGDRCLGFGLVNQINAFHRFANVGYWIRTAETGRGYATALVRYLAAFAFGELGLERVELVIEPTNAASIAVAEKVGAEREGLLRRRLAGRAGPARDAFMYSLVNDR